MNRDQELAALERWWSAPRSGLALVWGRRRVGKTALLQEFARSKRAVFFTATGRPVVDELLALTRAAAPVVGPTLRDLQSRPFVDWDDALEGLASAARDGSLLLVVDEFPELLRVTPELPSIIRAGWERIGSGSQLRLLLCGSAVRTMESAQEERSPLYGRLDLALLLHPFRPHEAREMLSRLRPSHRAMVYCLLGGVPLYLSMWDQDVDVHRNLLELVCTPGAPLLTEGQLVLRTEGDAGDLVELVLRAIAAGRTRYNEIADAVRAEPARTLDRLIQLRLVERVVPITEDPRRSRRRIYRIADNFLRFWLGVVDRYRTEIERGLGRSILGPLVKELDDHLGSPWEEAFRTHLRVLAEHGDLADDVVGIGPWWDSTAETELDAVAIAGRERAAVLVGEAKWAKRVSGERVVRSLEAKAARLPRVRQPMTFAVCAREEVTRLPRGGLAVVAGDIF